MQQSDRSIAFTVLFKEFVKPIIHSVPVALITGSLVAFFYYLLDKMTQIHWHYGWLLFLLPPAGIVIHLLYKYSGKNAEKGNTLIIEEIHRPGAGVPLRMTPLVLLTTLITHLFGGSAGREGTAVQMGGSIAGALARWFRLTPGDTRILLMCGVAAGFGAIFGTPLAGAVFALEIIRKDARKYKALLPCIASALLADLTGSAWGIHHVHYKVAMPDMAVFMTQQGALLLLKAAIAGLAFGMAAWLFINVQDNIKKYSIRYIYPLWLIPFTGGVLIIIMCYLAGTTDYTGLGVVSEHPGGVSIVHSFLPGGAGHWSWLWKLLFTAITLGTGFKGGEVTPLFFMGATLGNTLAWLGGAPTDLFAALGFIAVFAGATKTPLASTLLGIELFGINYLPCYLVACFASYLCSGRPGIYSSKELIR